jgi:hypothetical protein
MTDQKKPTPQAAAKEARRAEALKRNLARRKAAKPKPKP